MSHGTDPRVSTDGGFSALHFLSSRKFDIKEEKQLQRVIKLFTDEGASINQKNRNFDTPLHLACACNNVIVANFLLQLKANVEGYNLFGYTPLMIALLHDHFHIIKLLLDCKVNTSILSDISFIQSLTSISKETIKILQDYNLIIQEPFTETDSFARNNLQNCKKHVKSLIQEKQDQNSKINKNPTQIIKTTETHILNNDLIIISPEIKKLWEKRFVQCFTDVHDTESADVTSPNSTPRDFRFKINENGILSFFESLNISIHARDYDFISQLISKDGYFTFKEFLHIFGSSIHLFSSHDSITQLKEKFKHSKSESESSLQSTIEKLTSSLENSNNNSNEFSSSSSSKSKKRKLASSVNAGRKNAKENLDSVISEISNFRKSANSRAHKFSVLRASTDINEISEKPSSLSKQQLQQQKPKSHLVLSKESESVKTPMINKPQIDLPSITMNKKMEPKPTHLIRSIQSIKLQEHGQKSQSVVLSREKLESILQKKEKNTSSPIHDNHSSIVSSLKSSSSSLDSHQNILDFAVCFCTVDEFSSAAQFFGSIYDRIILQENTKDHLLSIDIFEEYFKDSFTSYNLLRTIVPTLMAQKDLEIQ